MLHKRENRLPIQTLLRASGEVRPLPASYHTVTGFSALLRYSIVMGEEGEITNANLNTPHLGFL